MQRVHDDDLTSEYDPAVQPAQTVFWDAFENDPATQSMHADTALVLLNVPSEQDVHELL
jgi:hypothetical protein